MNIADSTMSASEEATISCGGAVAGSIFGTIACIIVLAIGAWFLYKKYWKNKSETNPLVEDAENSKVDYAFDNPAFKGDNNKNNSPFDNKWKTPDKRKTVDDSYANAPIPRLVPLRGSDFTGLGIEVCGGLKDGIYVKKVMPQGPAANIVHRGDKITSITIDFRHIVQEDAATILSYASPYNVQLELIDSNGTATNVLSQNASQPALAHPLYRPRSQEDLNTIERNARKKLFTKDDNSYPTLKMDQQQHGIGVSGSSAQQSAKPRSPATHLPQAHEENEKKNSLKKIQNYFIDMVEEKFQTKSSASAAANESSGAVAPTEGKKGMKFGIRVLPPSLIAGSKSTVDSGKSPNKVQADNDNNANIEKIECTSGVVEKVITVQQQQQQQQQQESCAPIVHPAPPEAMKRNKNKASKVHPAVTTAASVALDESKPTPFERQASINSSGIKRDAAGIPQEMPTELMQAAMTAINNRSKGNSIDRLKSKGKAPIPPLHSGENDDENDIDNVDQANVRNDMMNKINKDGIQSEMDSDGEFNGNKMQQIELNSKHITVHQASEEEEDTSEERKTASLGDLSKLENTCANNNRHQSTNGTLERAQSLEMSADANNHIVAGKVTPKKRKSRGGVGGDLVEVMELKEPRYSEPIIENLEPLHTVRLKSSYEWGNLEDAIYDGKGMASDDSFELDSPQKKLSASSMDMMSEVLAAADKFDKEINDIELNDVMNEIGTVEFDLASPSLSLPSHNTTVNGMTMDGSMQLPPPLPHQMVHAAADNNGMSAENNNNINNGKDNGIHTDCDEMQQQNITQIKLPTAVHLEVDIPADNFDDIVIDSSKAIQFGTVNISDDAKASRYPSTLSSLERPKSEVLKQLIAQHIPDDDLGVVATAITEQQQQAVEVNGVSFPKNANHKDGPMVNICVGKDELDIATAAATSVELPKQQVSPVYSSDGSGINNISISSIESDIQTTGSKASAASSPTIENRVTISTTDSQPSSIVIEDETLNFKMQTLDNEPNESEVATAFSGKTIATTQKAKNEVFIVESLSSKKEKTNEASSLPVVSNGRDVAAAATTTTTTTALKSSPSPPTKGFVTEIRFPNANKDRQMNAKNLSKSLENRNHSPTADVKTPATATAATRHSVNSEAKSSANTSPTQNNRKGSTPIVVEEEYIPRNNEIRFTTSTYQSPRQFDKRHSQIDQIRSNFERSHTSEIPIPIRKISTPSTPPPSQSSNGARVSPSKIPVFTSQKSSDNLLKNNNNGNRVSVSVTSIKNSSRNPSGK